MADNRQPFSMIRSYTWADLLTLGNATCGTVTIFMCLSYLTGEHTQWLWTGFVLPIFAFVFDSLDGYVARLTKSRGSRLGADLDSLADVVSFGVAPAVLGYTLGLRGLLDTVLLSYFVCCGISRLARFNVTADALRNVETGKVKYFEGLPSPSSILLVGLLALLFQLGLTGDNFWLGDTTLIGRHLHPFSLLFGVSGSLMISTIKVPKL